MIKDLTLVVVSYCRIHIHFLKLYKNRKLIYILYTVDMVVGWLRFFYCHPVAYDLTPGPVKMTTQNVVYIDPAIKLWDGNLIADQATV